MYSGNDRRITSTRCPSAAPMRPVTRGTISACATKATAPASTSASCATISVATIPGRIAAVVRSHSHGSSAAASPWRRGAGMMSWDRNRHSAPCPIGGVRTVASITAAKISQPSSSRGRIHSRTVAISAI